MYILPMDHLLYQATPDAATKERLRRLRSGCVLLARDTLRDPNFDATVVLVCVHNDDGAYGLVLNRPSHMPLSEMFDGFAGRRTSRRIFIGGPVRQEELQVLYRSVVPREGAFEIEPGIYMGGKWNNVADILELEEDSSRLFLGYSGWAPEQLEFEIIAGAWEVYNIDLRRLFADSDMNVVGKDPRQLDTYLRQFR